MAHRSRFGTRGFSNHILRVASQKTFDVCKNRRGVHPDASLLSLFDARYKKQATRSPRLSRLLHTLKSMACTHRENVGIMKLRSTETRRFNRFSLLPPPLLPRDVWSTLVLRILSAFAGNFHAKPQCERGGEKSLLFLMLGERKANLISSWRAFLFHLRQVPVFWDKKVGRSCCFNCGFIF